MTGPLLGSGQVRPLFGKGKLRRLPEFARAEKLARVTAEILPENNPMAKVCKLRLARRNPPSVRGGCASTITSEPTG